MFFEEMCSTYSVIWKFIEAQTKKICSSKSSSKRQFGLATASWDWAWLTGARMHSQQQNSFVNTNAGKGALKNPSQSSVILELLMWKIILYYRKNPRRLPHTHSSLRAATRSLFKLSILTLIAAAPWNESLQERKPDCSGHFARMQ